MQTERHTDTHVIEQAGYLEVSGAYLYTVLHHVVDPVARVLLVGPFASERHFSYHPWVRWARYLAARGIEVLRYDYRGVGESTGAFADMTFATWSEDVRILGGWLASQSPKVPLILHGLEIGGILAANVFQDGEGDALLLWSSPADANQALRSSLMRWAGLEQLYESTENRRSAAEYIRLLEQGIPIEVAGYRWSSILWRDSFTLRMPTGITDASLASERPFKMVRLERDSAPLVKPYVGYDELKCLKSLYSVNFAWIAQSLGLPAGSQNG